MADNRCWRSLFGEILVQGTSCARRRSSEFLGTSITRRRRAKTCGSAVTLLERRRCWVTRRRPGRRRCFALHSTRAQPGNHADLGRACLGSSRALDAGEPVSEEARRSSGCSWGSACPASSTTASEACGQWSTSANSGPEVALLLVDQLDLTGYYAFSCHPRRPATPTRPIRPGPGHLRDRSRPRHQHRRTESPHRAGRDLSREGSIHPLRDLRIG